MMHSNQALYTALQTHLTDINTQIDSVMEETRKRIEAQPYPEAYPRGTFDARDRDGRPVLQDLLLAKSNCLNGMAALKAAESQKSAHVSRPARGM